MVDNRTAPLGAFILRVSLGVMFLAHALLLKLGVFGLDGTTQFFVSLGLPAWTAPATILAETLAGLALVIGFWARFAAVATIPVLLGALWVHAGNGWVFNAPNGGWEYPLFLVVIAAVVALLGDGAYALRRTPSLSELRGARLSRFELP
jgi:putative oxidoreductase